MSIRQGKIIFRFLRYVRPFRFIWLWAILLGGLGSLLSLTPPYFLKKIVDEAIAQRDVVRFFIYALAGGVMLALVALLNACAEYLNRSVKLKVRFALRCELFERVQGVALSWFENTSTGEHIFKFEHDIDQIVECIISTIPQAAKLALMLCVTTVVLWYLNWQLALLSFAIAPVLFLVPLHFNRKIQSVYREWFKKSEAWLGYFEEAFSHIPLIKVFGREGAAVKKFCSFVNQENIQEMKVMRVELASRFAAGAAGKFCLGVVFVYGMRQVIRGTLSFGSLTAITAYLFQLVGLQNQCSLFFQAAASGFVSGERISGMMEEIAAAPEPADNGEMLLTRAAIEFKEVSFAYPQREGIFTQISFRLPEGMHVALTGLSGCGKTTIILLLLGMYGPSRGDILFGGQSINKIKKHSLLSQVGVAMQEPFLWNDSIEANIRFGRENASAAVVREAARVSGAEGFISTLPHGYHTVIGENACKLSEGQKQRIAIARAIVKEPSLLILDEAMSSLDSQSEEIILNNIKKSYPGMTLITVSHRISSVRQADRVYFLAGPQEMVSGSCVELFGKDSRFAALFAGQT